VLGGLFGTTRKVVANSELFLFLTPHVVTTDQETERLRQGVEQAAPLVEEAMPAERTLAPEAAPSAAPNPLQQP
jgi:type II secretory pathway component GspD/PulD (secretin)